MRRAWGVLICGGLVAIFLGMAGFYMATRVAAQGVKVRPGPESEVEDRDHPLERQQWFRQGRAVSGKVAADLLLHAYRQKLQLRAFHRATARVASIASTTTATAISDWHNVGPAALVSDPSNFQSYGAVTGRTTSVAIDQNDDSGNTVYAGGAFGGVWKSTNATAAPSAVSWTALTDGQPTLAVGAIALKPDTTGASTVILAGTGEPDDSGDSYYGLGILRSADAGTTWQLITADSVGHSFKGLGFTKIAFNTTAGNTSQVVAAASNTTNFTRVVAPSGSFPLASLYYSSDAGLTWNLSFLSDDGINPIAVTSATDVVFNPAANRFYALVRRHGLYSSADGGKTWLRLANQPGGALLSSAVCSSSFNIACPLFRGHVAVQPTTGELFVATMNLDSSGGQTLQGVFRSADSGNTWSADLGQNGYSNCGDTAGCGAAQSVYNFYLSALPGNQGTDLYLGGINIYRCSLAPASTACNWTNLTHVYGCAAGGNIGAPSHVHPDQHSMAFLAANPQVMYFANDGGIYRSLNGAATDGSCNASNASSWQNLNGSLGPVAEFVWLSQDSNNSGVLLGGTQDNGSPALNNGAWAAVNTGDGGYNDIDPTNSATWYSSNFDVSIQRCPFGAGCSTAEFADVVTSSSVSNDGSNFYPPFMLDPRDPRKLILGTCRVWRGASDGTGWPGANALSFNFAANSAQVCSPDSSGQSMVSALAAGGPAGPSGASQVIYAGRGDGHIFVSTSAESGPASFADRSFAPLAGSYKISAIAVDASDASGQTAIATRMGFGVAHVWRTTNAGVTWNNINGNLPDAPADSVLVDPADRAHIMVGMDVGVFETRDTGTTWSEVAAGLPSVPVTRLLLFDGVGERRLRVATYGRGVWEVGLPPVPFFALQLAPGANSSVTLAAGQSASFQLALTSANGFTGNVAFTCSGAASGTTCAMNPAAITLSAAANNVPVTVTITASPAAAQNHPPFTPWPLVFAAVMAGILWSVAGKPNRVLLAVLTLSLAATIISCGGGGSGATAAKAPAAASPAGSSASTVVVTATSGSQMRSVSLNVVIK